VIKLCVAAGLLYAGIAHAADALPDIQRMIQLSASVLKIEALADGGGLSLGSGVVVAPERVATNCHVTRRARSISVIRGGVRWLASTQAARPDHDLCVLSVPGLIATPVTLAPSSPHPGDRLIAMGYTGGVELQHSAGEVVALHRYDSANVIESTNFFNSGASGGGLFNADYALVGLLTFRRRGGPTPNYFAAPVDWLTPLLSEGPQDRPVAPLEGKAQAYWERGPAELPPFLRTTTVPAAATPH